jgi:hypothetical protein
VQRTLIESDRYRQKLAALGDAQRMGVTWALCNNPMVYEVVKGMRDIRLLKTDAFPGAPAVRIWFRIDEDGAHVHLEDIEPVEGA